MRLNLLPDLLGIAAFAVLCPGPLPAAAADAAGAAPAPAAGAPAAKAAGPFDELGSPAFVSSAEALQKSSPELVGAWLEARATQARQDALSKTFGTGKRKGAETEFRKAEPQLRRAVAEFERLCTREKAVLTKQTLELLDEQEQLAKRQEKYTGAIAEKLAQQGDALYARRRQAQDRLDTLEAMSAALKKGDNGIQTDVTLFGYPARDHKGKVLCEEYDEMVERRKFIMDLDADLAAIEARQGAAPTAADQGARARTAAAREKAVDLLAGDLRRARSEAERSISRLQQSVDRLSDELAASQRRSKAHTDRGQALKRLNEEMELATARLGFFDRIAQGTGLENAGAPPAPAEAPKPKPVN